MKRLICLVLGHTDEKVEKALLLPHNLLFNGEWMAASSLLLRCSRCNCLRSTVAAGNWADAMKTKDDIRALERMFSN